MQKIAITVLSEEKVDRFRKFIEKYYYEPLLNSVKKGIRSLKIDFSSLAKFDLELSEQLIENFDETIASAEEAVKQLDIPEAQYPMRIRIVGLPKSDYIKIRDIRARHLGRLIATDGLIRQSSDIRPKVTLATFECAACGARILVEQPESKFREPVKCSCGRQGKFKLISKKMVDVQRLVIEESPEALEGGEQPKRIAAFLQEDLLDPKLEKKRYPGNKIKIAGVIKEVPVPLKTGGQSTTYDLLVDVNSLETVEEEFEDIEISAEDEKIIRELAAKPNIYEKLVATIAPSIYGYDNIKKAIVMQLFGGVKKLREDGTNIRGDIHLFLIGDPGCIAGDSKVALYYKGMEEIQNLGDEHLQKIHQVVAKIRKNSKDLPYSIATTFHRYPRQPVLKLTTETGKSIICTYNQPLLTKSGWKRADELSEGAKIRVAPKIPNLIKKFAPTTFASVKKSSGKLKENIFIPKEVTPELAALYGYIIGDGNIHPKGYRVTCYVNNEETDLIEKLKDLWKDTFNVATSLTAVRGGRSKTIKSGAVMRKIISTKPMYILEVNSRQAASCLSFLKNKRVPVQIFKSPNFVIAQFLKWLFEADGCAFAKGRGRAAIQLKSKHAELLGDVQQLLLFFGTQARIIQDNLTIRRSRDMELYAKHIGFASEKKKTALSRLLAEIKNKSYTQKRKNPQRYERVAKVTPAGVTDVYDFEVPVDKQFIANGIVCHNSGKSQLLRYVSTIAPKARYTAGKGSTAAGMTATVVRDEFLRGWALEAGVLVLCNKGIACLDEMDKMTPEDTSAMHEALEQQTITIAKANIHATLIAETSVLAAANPKFGRFDPYEPVPKQINLPPTLLNRFDLIFTIKDIPNVEKDEKIASHILKLAQDPTLLKPDIDTKLLRKYIAFAHQRCAPKLTVGAIEEIKTFYIDLRKMAASEEGEVKPIPISPRQLEALVRLSEASAKIRLSDKVTKKDAQIAVDLLKSSMQEVAFDVETGKFDIDRITTGITASQRSQISILRRIIDALTERVGKSIPVQDIVKEAEAEGVPRGKAEEIIAQLVKSGEIYEPKPGLVSKVGY